MSRPAPRPAGTVPTPPERISAGFVVLMGALIAVAPFTIDLYLAAFPQITSDLRTEPAAVQLTLTTTLAGLAVGQLIIGSLSDALGRRRPLIAGLVLYVLVSLAVALVSSVALLAVLRFLQGFAAAAGTVLVMAMVRDRYSGVRMGKVIARMQLVMGVAPVLAPVIGAQVLRFGDWRLLFLGLAALGVALVLLATFVLGESLPPERRRSGGLRPALRSYRELLGDGGFIGLALLNGLAFGALFTYVSSSSFVFQEGFGLSTQQFALVFAAGSIGIISGTQLSGFLVGRVAPRRMIQIGISADIAAAAALLVVALAGGGPVAVAAMMVVILFLTGCVLPSVPVLALDANAHRAGSAAALLGAIQFGVGSAVAPLSGLFGATTATSMALVLLIALTLAGVLVLVLRNRMQLRPTERTLDSSPVPH
ncbi:multidrug effflux MFS transporter [Nakamurella leprariae]|uniref:Multidrug effflux MFS transporter n=1 Tax=Nakamurella leprariae TaxID=2803911 RepID=A0A938YDC6_9ACTN|nr:multidrug effflux MFS transporter [Nakamurella leprariae]MBM9466372.1 multidrug effflux MFS transporter [Nakamurella leprariae]